MRIDKNTINKIRKVETVDYRQYPYTINKITVNGVAFNYADITNYATQWLNNNK